MAAGIQHVQATQLIKISSPSTEGMAALKDIKWQNSKCGTCSGGRSVRGSTVAKPKDGNLEIIAYTYKVSVEGIHLN